MTMILSLGDVFISMFKSSMLSSFAVRSFMKSRTSPSHRSARAAMLLGNTWDGKKKWSTSISNRSKIDQTLLAYLLNDVVGR